MPLPDVTLYGLWIIFHILNIILCWEDFKTLHVSLYTFICLIACFLGIIWLTKPPFIEEGIIIFLIIYFGGFIKLKSPIMAFADAIYIITCILYVSDSWPYFFILLGFFTILLNKSIKQQKIPLFPVIYAAFCVFLFYQWV